jgi:hypothetical protein
MLAASFYGKPLPKAITEPKAPKVEAVVDVKAAKVTGTFTTKQGRKNALERVSNQYRKLQDQLQKVYLAIPADVRNGNPEYNAKCDLYYGVDLHNWKPKHSEAWVREYPGNETVTRLVAEIEVLVKARAAIKAAP